MEKRNFILIIFLALSLMFTSFSVSFADPSQLIVVRASDNSLWKSTCEGTTCTAFSSFPGQFTSQPAVIWDEDLSRFVLWGRGGDGAVWRSTFTRFGVFNNDWTIPIPGSTPSPPGAAGGGIVNNFGGSGQSHGSVVVADVGVTNIQSLSVDAPYGGFFVCNASGDIGHNRIDTTTSWNRIYISDVSGGTETTFSVLQFPSGYPTGQVYIPWAFQRWFSVSAGSHDFYVTAEKSGTATITFWDTMLHCQFQPYSY